MPRYIEEIVSRQVQLSTLARRKAEAAGEPVVRPVVTMSRLMGSGARIIANKLAEDLGWSLWDRELIDAMAENADVSRHVVELFDEHTISDLELFARGALGQHEMAGFLYPKHLAKAVYAIAKLGNAIILGRGANFILADALSVRVEASMDRRIENMVQYENMPRSQAEAHIHQSDRERQHFLERVFGKSHIEACSYDLTLCMDHLSNDDAVTIIKTAIKQRFHLNEVAQRYVHPE